jgi:glycosyltransferase involved in cell wall biosynthesis
LKSRLARVLDDDRERDRRGKAAREFAKRYSWEKTAADLIDLYEEIRCSSRSRR